MGIRICRDQEGVPKGRVRYDFDVRYEGSRYRERIICQKSAVQTFYNRFEKKIIENLNGYFSLYETLNEYLLYSLEMKTPRMYKHERMIIEEVVKKFFKKNMLLREIKRSNIEELVLWRRTFIKGRCDNMQNKMKLSNATINRTLSVISYFFNWCIKKGYYNAVNPCFRIKLREINSREVRMTEDQIQKLLGVAYKLDTQFYYVVMFALLTGMRRGEILNLQWTEVSFDSSYIMLSQYKTKNKRARVIPITESIREILLILKNTNPGSQLVFSQMTPDIIKKRWNKLRNMLPFDSIRNGSKPRFHDLRHIFAQTLLDKGVGLEDIQTLLGHQSYSTTEKRYAMFARPDLLEKASILNNVIKLNRKTG